MPKKRSRSSDFKQLEASLQPFVDRLAKANAMPELPHEGLKHALVMRGGGYRVFPILCDDSGIWIELTDEPPSTSAETIRGWWADWPHAWAAADLGIAGWIVIGPQGAIEVRHDDAERFAKVRREHRRNIEKLMGWRRRG